MIKKLRKRFMLVIMTALMVLITGILVCVYLYMYSSEKENAGNTLEFAISWDFADEKIADDFLPDKNGTAMGKPEENDPPPDAKEAKEKNESESSSAEDEESSEEGSGEFHRPKEPDVERDDIRFGNSVFFNYDETGSLMSGWIMVQTDASGEKWVFHSQINRDENGNYTSGTTELDASYAAAAQKVIDNGDESGYITFDDTQYRYIFRAIGDGYRIVFLDRTGELATLHQLLYILGAIFIGAIAVTAALAYALSSWTMRPTEDAWNRQSVFFSNASHELKTPLTVISANLDVIQSNPDSTVREQERWFGYVKSEVAKMSQLIGEMLYIAREDAQSEKKPIMSEFDFSELVEGECLTFEALAFERGRFIEQDIAPGIVGKGEKESIQRVVRVLIDNAISHSSENSSVKVSLSLSKHGKIKLTVSNEGEDIPPESLNRIFDRYYRTDASRSKDTGGFGLGLAIAKTIVDKHGGTISAESENGITTFKVVFLP